MRPSPTYTSWKITCRSAADAQSLQQWLLARIDSDRVLTDISRVAPNGVEEFQSVQHRLGDYFASIRILPDPKSNPAAFRLVFQRQPNAGRFWKDLMVDVLQEIKGTPAEPSVEVEPTAAEAVNAAEKREKEREKWTQLD